MQYVQYVRREVSHPRCACCTKVEEDRDIRDTPWSVWSKRGSPVSGVFLLLASVRETAALAWWLLHRRCPNPRNERMMSSSSQASSCQASQGARGARGAREPA